jgi:hypothetical protein
MGCWDIFCFLCGNRCHGAVYTNDVFLQDIEYYESGKRDNFFKAYFKPIYETYKKEPIIFDKKIKLLEKNTKWLNNCTFLCANNKIIHDCEEVSCGISFRDKKNNIYKNRTYYDEEGLYGVFTHTDCWKFIKNEYNLSLNYSHLPINIHDSTRYKIFDFINYGVIEKYWNQDFNFIKMIYDGNEELSYNPLKNKLVAKNIKKIFSKLKIRTDSKRIKPAVSATFYKPYTYKVGENGNIWKVIGNKWIECKDTVKMKLLNPIKKIVLVGDYNNTPIFILNMKKNKKMIEYDILSINSI